MVVLVFWFTFYSVSCWFVILILVVFGVAWCLVWFVVGVWFGANRCLSNIVFGSSLSRFAVSCDLITVWLICLLVLVWIKCVVWLSWIFELWLVC